jgi:uncharacterized protein (TIGR02453 family)
VSRHAATPSFEGFPEDFHAFFRELVANNDRDWFQANKDRFKASVQAPLLAFIGAMDVPLGRIADCFIADARPVGGSMFRIHRDTRFSKDKKPLKENAACHFRHMAGKDAHAPGFYVHLSPDEVFFGGGIWSPPSPVVGRVRDAIVADPNRWVLVTRSPAFRRRFGAVAGDSLKRPPRGYDGDHPLVEDLKRTSFFAMQRADPAAIHSRRFVADVAKAFEAMVPFIEFLTDALDLPMRLPD